MKEAKRSPAKGLWKVQNGNDFQFKLLLQDWNVAVRNLQWKVHSFFFFPPLLVCVCMNCLWSRLKNTYFKCSFPCILSWSIINIFSFLTSVNIILLFLSLYSQIYVPQGHTKRTVDQTFVISHFLLCTFMMYIYL